MSNYKNIEKAKSIYESARKRGILVVFFNFFENNESI